MINLTYTLLQHGWATIDAELGPTRVRCLVSYMSHALNDLVSATIASLSGQPVVRFALIDEPGSHCWVLSRKENRLQITVFHIDSMYAVENFNQYIADPAKFIERYKEYGRVPDTSPPEEGGHFVASVECQPIEFGTTVARMLEQIERQYTPEDFAHGRNEPVNPELTTQLSKLLQVDQGT
jgi:hypothetical protein